MMLKQKESTDTGKTKKVMLRIKTGTGTRTLTLKIKPAQRDYQTLRAYGSSPQSQDIFANIFQGGAAVQGEGIRTGILTPVYGMQPANQGLATAATAATMTVRTENQEPEEKPVGIKVPEISEHVDIIGGGETTLEELRALNIKYPLIPKQPKEGERVFAYAHIFFDRATNEIIYNVIEPPLDANLKKLVAEVKEYAQQKIDVNFAQVRKREAIVRLDEIVEKGMNFFKVLNRENREVVKYYVLRDFIGLEMIEPILNDRSLEDISCDGANIPLYVYHRDPRLGSLRTNVTFDNKDELDLFVNKLAERCDKVISVSHPLLDASLLDGSRVQATLGSDIARRGSNFTIRMFTEKPLTPVDIIKFGTADLRITAFLWFLIEHAASVLICGGTASGKTSLLNVLSMFIKPQMKIVSIEDTPELRLPHSHWIPEVARAVISETGKVDMFELLRESLRQRPDYIIVGEVRGKEAYVLFQQMAVGHPGMSTLHAENFQKLVDRLTNPPISLPANLMQNLDVVIFIKRIRQERRYKRRIASVTEVIGYDSNTKLPITNEVFVWDPKADVYVVKENSVILKKLSDSTNMSEDYIQEEIRKRVKILKWMVDKDITDYKKTGYIFNIFYTAPEFLLQRIGNLW